MWKLSHLILAPWYKIIFTFSKIVEEDYLKILLQDVAS